MSGDLYGDLPAGFELLPQGKIEVKKVVIKLYLKKDQTYKTLAVQNTTPTSEVLALYAKKLGRDAALGQTLELRASENGVERTLSALEKPGALQLIWLEEQTAAANRFYVAFSDAGRRSIRLEVARRRSSAAEHPVTSAATAAAAASPASSVLDDLAALDEIAAEFAASGAAASSASGAGQGAGVRAQLAGRTKTTAAGRQRLKMIPLAKDDEYQGLLAALREGAPSRSASSVDASARASSSDLAVAAVAKPRPVPGRSSSSAGRAAMAAEAARTSTTSTTTAATTSATTGRATTSNPSLATAMKPSAAIATSAAADDSDFAALDDDAFGADDLVALDDFNNTMAESDFDVTLDGFDNDDNTATATTSNSNTNSSKVSPSDDFDALDASLSSALAGLDELGFDEPDTMDSFSTSGAGSDGGVDDVEGIEIDFDDMLAQLSKQSGSLDDQLNSF